MRQPSVWVLRPISAIPLLLRVTDAAPGTAVDKLITLAVIGIAVVAYGVLLLVLHAIDREDMLLLRKVKKLQIFYI